jgi:hypothetical protein
VAVDDELVYWAENPVGRSVVSWADKTDASLVRATAGLNGSLHDVREMLVVPDRQWLIAVSRDSQPAITALDRDGTVVGAADSGTIEDITLLHAVGAPAEPISLQFTLPALGWIGGVVLEEASVSPPWQSYVVVQNLNDPAGITEGAVGFDYFTERDFCSSNGTIKALPVYNFDGNPLVVATGVPCPTRLEADEDAIYVLSGGDGSGAEGTGSVLRVPIIR